MGLLRETLLTAIARDLAGRPMHIGTAADAIAPAAYGELVVRFPGVDPAVGDATVWIADEQFDLGGLVSAAVSVGDVMHDTFDNFDTHLPAPERAARVAGEVVRFLRELFEDRLLLWRSVDGRSAWRERSRDGHLEPLVFDDATYHRYLWSGALPPWRATDAILARGRIADDHEHHLVRQRLEDTGAGGFDGSAVALALRLVAEYRSSHGI